MFLILSFNISSLNTATLKLYNNKQIKNNVKLAQRKKKIWSIFCIYIWQGNKILILDKSILLVNQYFTIMNWTEFYGHLNAFI